MSGRSTAARKSGSKSRLTVERLEERQLLAGNITFDPLTGIVTVAGTRSADTVRVVDQNGDIEVSISGGATEQASFDARRVNSVRFDALEGDDVFINNTTERSTVFAGPGRDYLEGGWRADKFYGEAGDDILVGYKGNDRLYGGLDNDSLFGMPGDDRLFGEEGNDGLYGGTGSDQLSDPLGINIRDGRTDGPLEVVAGPFASQKLRDYLNGALSAIERAIVDLVNQERISRGLNPLQVDSRLADGAQHHARNMARLETMAHNLPGADLPDPEDRLAHYGYDWSAWAENVAYGYATAQQVMNAWMNSAGHRANILDPNLTEIGVGVRYSDQGVPYYCQLFGRPL